MQLLLAGIYARLFAIASNVAKVYDLDMGCLMDGQRTRRVKVRATVTPVVVDVGDNLLDEDVGQVITRGVESAQATFRDIPKDPNSIEIASAIAPHATHLAPSETISVQKRKPSTAGDISLKKKKKKKGGSIDDIFGF